MTDENKVIPFPRCRRAQNCSKPMTDDLRAKVKTMVTIMGMAQRVTAAKLRVNAGRVSETLNDPQYRDIPFAPLSEVVRL
jgi:hypothetical protein